MFAIWIQSRTFINQFDYFYTRKYIIFQIYFDLKKKEIIMFKVLLLFAIGITATIAVEPRRDDQVDGSNFLTLFFRFLKSNIFYQISGHHQKLLLFSNHWEKNVKKKLALQMVSSPEHENMH